MSLDPEMLIYQTEDGNVSVEVNVSGETVWLSLKQIASLFERAISVISKHLKHIFKD